MLAENLDLQEKMFNCRCKLCYIYNVVEILNASFVTKGICARLTKKFAIWGLNWYTEYRNIVALIGTKAILHQALL